MTNNNLKNNDDSMNGLFKNLGKFITVVGDMVNSGENVMKSSGEIGNLNNDKVKTAYNFSVKMGLNDDIKSHFANITNKTYYPTRIEPNIDIFEEEKEFTIILMVNSIDEKDIRIQPKNDILVFEAENENVHYYKEISTPPNLEINNVKWSYKNGVIKIDIPRQLTS